MGVKIEEKKQSLLEEAYGGEGIEKYKALQTAKQRFMVRFTQVDKDGNLKTFKDGVKIVLERKELVGNDGNMDYWSSYGQLQRSFNCKVKKVDVKNNTVYCAYQSLLVYRKMAVSSDQEAELRQEVLFNKGKVPVIARVKEVTPSGLLLDILDMGIVGFVSTRNYRPTYTSDIVGAASKYKNALIEVLVTGYNPSKKQWLCSRSALMEDPWKRVGQEYSKGDIITVKAVELHPDKGYFFAEISTQATTPVASMSENGTIEYAYDELEVMVDFPTERNKRIDGIQVGEYYVCKVKEVEPEKRIFRAASFAKAEK